MYHPHMMIRPDGIVRSGIIQPFSVRSMDPVQFARHEIDPFINAIRPGAAQYMDGGGGGNGVNLGSHFGATVAQQVPGAIGITRVQDMPLFGRTQKHLGQAIEDKNTKFFFLAGGTAAGILVGFLLGRAMKRGKKR
jgi:hypothetical protein